MLVNFKHLVFVHTEDKDHSIYIRKSSHREGEREGRREREGEGEGERKERERGREVETSGDLREL